MNEIDDRTTHAELFCSSFNFFPTLSIQEKTGGEGTVATPAVNPKPGMDDIGADPPGPTYESEGEDTGCSDVSVHIALLP